MCWKIKGKSLSLQKSEFFSLAFHTRIHKHSTAALESLVDHTFPKNIQGDDMVLQSGILVKVFSFQDINLKKDHPKHFVDHHKNYE